ncbi:hypothetical protein NGUA05_03531 [Salmonella enterica]|nr:hypothetical protein NGUA05_03531 [Salmonella enterica]GAS42251.1 hypothetical protein NGUA33_02758 [Salmonella enterica]
MTPVAQRVHVAEIQAGLQSLGDIGDGAGDLTGDEGFAATRGLMVKQNAVTGVNTVGFTVVDGDPVGVQFRYRIGGTRVERRGLFLRNFLHQTVQFRGGGLVEPRFLFKTEEADRLQQAQRAHRIHIGGIFRRLKRHRHVAHRAQVVDLIRLHFL